MRRVPPVTPMRPPVPVPVSVVEPTSGLKRCAASLGLASRCRLLPRGSLNSGRACGVWMTSGACIRCRSSSPSAGASIRSGFAGGKTLLSKRVPAAHLKVEGVLGPRLPVSAQQHAALTQRRAVQHPDCARRLVTCTRMRRPHHIWTTRRHSRHPLGSLIAILPGS